MRSILGPREDFTRVPNGDWGLSDWYPGQGRGKKAKAEKPAKKEKSKKKRKAKKPNTTPEVINQSEAAPVPEAPPKAGPQGLIEAYLVNHPAATSREIADALGIRIQTVGLILGKNKRKAT